MSEPHQDDDDLIGSALDANLENTHGSLNETTGDFENDNPVLDLTDAPNDLSAEPVVTPEESSRSFIPEQRRVCRS
jgi:hypothetical protein